MCRISRIPSNRRWFRKQSAREAHATAFDGFDGPRQALAIASFTVAKAATSLKRNQHVVSTCWLSSWLRKAKGNRELSKKMTVHVDVDLASIPSCSAQCPGVVVRGEFRGTSLDCKPVATRKAIPVAEFSSRSAGTILTLIEVSSNDMVASVAITALTRFNLLRWTKHQLQRTQVQIA